MSAFGSCASSCRQRSDTAGLTGREAPAAGGKVAAELTPEEKAVDRQARLTISRELGHVREAVSAVYLGR